MTIKTVLSLFGGIECGRMALDSLGIKPERYFSSEIDPYPIQNTKHNFPDIVHIGDVTDISYNEGTLIANGFSLAEQIYDGYCGEIVDIDLLLAGSPCQDVSNAGAQKGLASTYEEYLERKQAGTATRSDLFWEFIRILGETKPKYFMLENVKMKKELLDIFNKAVGFEGDMIDAALLSPQSRKRMYWCGKLNPDGTYSKVYIPQPKDAGMKLKDILEDIPFDAVDEKGKPIWKPVPDKYIPLIQEREGILQIPRGKNKGNIFSDKVPTISANQWQDNNKLVGQWRRTNIRIHADQEKCPTLTANMGTGGNNVPFITSEYMWRPLTVRECARCQGIPESYEFVTSKSRSYKCIGNGWEVRTVAHNLSYLLA